jgi:hydrogenase expression/formation protein HypE
MALPEKHAEKVLSILHSNPSGKDASIIGKVLKKSSNPQVILKTLYDTERILETSSGELLPRIC